MQYLDGHTLLMLFVWNLALYPTTCEVTLPGFVSSTVEGCQGSQSYGSLPEKKWFQRKFLRISAVFESENFFESCNSILQNFAIFSIMPICFFRGFVSPDPWLLGHVSRNLLWMNMHFRVYQPGQWCLNVKCTRMVALRTTGGACNDMMMLLRWWYDMIRVSNLLAKFWDICVYNVIASHPRKLKIRN